MTSPPPEQRYAAATETDDPAEALRGELFTGLDRLAFALEWEAAEAVEQGEDERAARLESQRLGVRLAQRFVAGVHADEVDLRIQATRAQYDARTGAGRPPGESDTGTADDATG